MKITVEYEGRWPLQDKEERTYRNYAEFIRFLRVLRPDYQGDPWRLTFCSPYPNEARKSNENPEFRYVGYIYLRDSAPKIRATRAVWDRARLIHQRHQNLCELVKLDERRQSDKLTPCPKCKREKAVEYEQGAWADYWRCLYCEYKSEYRLGD